ncbi:MAG: sensor histidine kinase [Candidatus Dormibacteraeota bacterium]|nr:sensor histidine kinase [Candidatus Dormibacteraeota bacterium]
MARLREGPAQLENAIKYSPSGGEVSISTSPEGGLASVSVSDQGVGIDPDRRQELSSPSGGPGTGTSRASVSASMSPWRWSGRTEARSVSSPTERPGPRSMMTLQAADAA